MNPTIQPKRIAIFQKELWVGGIQKSLLNLLAGMADDPIQIDLFLFDTHIFYDAAFPKNVTVHFLKPFPPAYRVLDFTLVRKLAGGFGIDDSVVYDAAVDFNSFQHECAVGALSVNAKKRIMWIHNDPEQTRKHELKYRLLWHCFKCKLNEYDAFAAVSQGSADAFRRLSGIREKPITIIPNLIDTAEIFRRSEEPVDFEPDPACVNYCTVGRLCHAKGIDLLLPAFAEAAKQREDLRLYIVGDGEDRPKLEKIIRRCQLGEKVRILGYQPNPFPYMKKMDGLVLNSRYEGQGMVLWEAKALGLPVLIPKRLEQYNEGISGVEDIVEAFCAAHKAEKQPDTLDWYNARSLARIRALLQASDTK